MVLLFLPTPSSEKYAKKNWTVVAVVVVVVEAVAAKTKTPKMVRSFVLSICKTKTDDLCAPICCYCC